MIGFSLALAFATLIVGLGLAVVASRLPTMRAQLVALVMVATLLPLGAVVVGGTAMLTDHDAATLLSLCTASLAVIVGATLIARRILAPITAVRRAASLVATGELSARAQESGTREVVQLTTAFNQMVAHLEELHDSRRQVVAWVSHDLRAPVASLQAMMEAEQDGVVPAHHYLEAMHDQVLRLAQMVGDLFELAQVDAGALVLDVQKTALRPLVDRCRWTFEAEANEHQIQLQVDIVDDLPDAHCAADKVQRVMENLLSNAIRHTPPQGTVRIRVVKYGTQDVLVRVEDSGTGLTTEATARMFDHFWRADPARSRGGGAGLGLAIARGLVEANGGRIWAEKSAEGGAALAFTLPAHPS